MACHSHLPCIITPALFVIAAAVNADPAAVGGPDHGRRLIDGVVRVLRTHGHRVGVAEAATTALLRLVVACPVVNCPTEDVISTLSCVVDVLTVHGKDAVVATTSLRVLLAVTPATRRLSGQQRREWMTRCEAVLNMVVRRYNSFDRLSGCDAASSSSTRSSSSSRSSSGGCAATVVLALAQRVLAAVMITPACARNVFVSLFGVL
jgi:hypothetical protein